MPITTSIVVAVEGTQKHHVVAFHKGGSRWVRQLFRYLARRDEMNVWVNLDNPGALNQNVDRQAAGTVMLYAVGPASLDAKAQHDSHRAAQEKTVVFVRDPKDVLVSQYWSWRNTHLRNTEEMDQARSVLQDMSVEEGLGYLIETDQLSFCHGARDWYPDLGDDYLRLARYESLLGDFLGEMDSGLSHLDLPASRSVLRRMQSRFSFEAVAKGRDRGQEDRSSPLRKGVEGDWVNYFDADLARDFDAQYGDVCDRLGYPRAESGRPHAFSRERA